MTNRDTDFETWFETLEMHVADRTGKWNLDQDTFREDYDAGKDVWDVIDETAAEYGDLD